VGRRGGRAVRVRMGTMGNTRRMAAHEQGSFSMTIPINSRDDLVDYVHECHEDMADHGLAGNLADAVQRADHPAWGEDWGEWLGEAIAGIRDDVCYDALRSQIGVAP